MCPKILLKFLYDSPYWFAPVRKLCAFHNLFLISLFSVFGPCDNLSTRSSFSYPFGLFVGDLDTVIAEAAVENFRVKVNRCFSDMFQSALALASQVKEDQTVKQNDAS